MNPITNNAKQYVRQEDQARCALYDQVQAAIAKILQEHGPEINCFTFHLELKRRFSFAVPWHLTKGHILTEIEGNYYDKTGLVLHRMDPLQFERAFQWEKT